MEKQHSKIGIASFAISIAAGCMILALLCVAGFLNAHRVHGERHYPGQLIVGFAAIALFAADVVAVGLGIAAVCQTEKKRVFGILGLVFSASAIIGTFGLVVLGLLVAGRFKAS